MDLLPYLIRLIQEGFIGAQELVKLVMDLLVLDDFLRFDFVVHQFFLDPLVLV